MPNYILTDRLLVRPYVASDGPEVVELLNDFAVSKWMSTIPHPYTDADVQLVNADGSSRWPELAAITLKGEIVGGISAGDHFGYWIGRAHWGQGIATEAAAAMLHYLFESEGRDEVTTGVFAGNRASSRILDRLGFREVSRNMIPCAARGDGIEVANINLSVDRSHWGQVSWDN